MKYREILAKTLLACCLALVVLTVVILGQRVAFADADTAGRYYEDAAAMFDRSDFAGATIQLKNALKEDPSLLAAHILLGKAYLAQGHGLEAEQELRDADRRGADRSVTVPLLAKAYRLQQKHKQLLQEFTVEGLTDAAQEDLLLTRGQTMVELGDFENAAKAFKRAETLDPQDVMPIVGQVTVALRRGDLDGAERLAKKAVTLAPDSADAISAEASIYQAQGDLEKALATYDRALKLDPKLHEARVARIATMFGLQQWR